MKEYNVRYQHPDGFNSSIDVTVGDHEDENDAMEAAREELTAESPGTDTDEWDILSAEEIFNAAENVRVERFDADSPPENFVAYLDREHVHIHIVRNAEGGVDVSVDHGYVEGSDEYNRERALFAENEDTIREQAPEALARYEALVAPAGPRP